MDYDVNAKIACTGKDIMLLRDKAEQFVRQWVCDGDDDEADSAVDALIVFVAALLVETPQLIEAMAAAMYAADDWPKQRQLVTGLTYRAEARDALQALRKIVLR